MVLADSNLVKRDKIKNPRDYDWYRMVGMQHRETYGKICLLKLVEAYADIEVVIQDVRDDGNRFSITGHFLDLDHVKDAGKWYLVEIVFIKSLDYAAIQFTPQPIYSVTQKDKLYIEHRRTPKPSV